MYNESQKKRYLKFCEKYYESMTIGLMERIFASTEKSEEQFNKDVCDFNQIEVVDFLKSLDSKSRRRLQSTCIRLSKYFEWCYNIEHLTNNIINPFDSRGIDPIIDSILPKDELNNKYFTKEQFLQMLSDIIDVSNKFIAYAFYSGLTVEELVNLKISDLDFKNNIINLVTGRKVSVDALFKHLMIETNDQTQYFPDGIEKETRNKAHDYASSGYVIRSCDKNVTDIVSGQYITSRMKTIKEQMGNNLISIPVLYKNGLVNYIKEQFAKKNIDLKTAILSPLNGRQYVHDKETEQYMSEYGSQMTVRFLRMEIKDYLDLL